MIRGHRFQRAGSDAASSALSLWVEAAEPPIGPARAPLLGNPTATESDRPFRGGVSTRTRNRTIGPNRRGQTTWAVLILLAGTVLPAAAPVSAVADVNVTGSGSWDARSDCTYGTSACAAAAAAAISFCVGASFSGNFAVIVPFSGSASACASVAAAGAATGAVGLPWGYHSIDAKVKDGSGITRCSAFHSESPWSPGWPTTRSKGCVVITGSYSCLKAVATGKASSVHFTATTAIALAAAKSGGCSTSIGWPILGASTGLSALGVGATDGSQEVPFVTLSEETQLEFVREARERLLDQFDQETSAWSLGQGELAEPLRDALRGALLDSISLESLQEGTVQVYEA